MGRVRGAVVSRPVLDLYVARDSALHRLDGRSKLLLAVGGAVAGVFLDAPLALAGLVVLVQALLVGAGVPRGRLGWVWRQLVPLNVLIFVLWPLFQPAGGALLLRVGPLAVTTGSLLGGLAAALRVDALAFWTLLPVFLTSQGDLVRGLIGLGLPYPVGLTLGLALRYLPSIYSLYEGVRQAQAARGWRPGRGLRWLRSQGPLLVATIVAAVRLAEQLALALAARGAGRGGLYRPRSRLRAADWLAIAAGLALAVASGWLRLLGG